MHQAMLRQVGLSVLSLSAPLGLTAAQPIAQHVSPLATLPLFQCSLQHFLSLSLAHRLSDCMQAIATGDMRQPFSNVSTLYPRRRWSFSDYLPSLVPLSLHFSQYRPIAPRHCIYDVTNFPDFVTHYLFANLLYYSSGHCPYSPSWQIALNLYIRLREVSLCLWPYSDFVHCYYKDIASFFLALLADDTSISMLPAIARMSQDILALMALFQIKTYTLYCLLLQWTLFNSRQLALVPDDYVYITITLHAHKTISH